MKFLTINKTADTINKTAFDNAVQNLNMEEENFEENYNESVKIMQLMRDGLILWDPVEEYNES